MPAPAGGNLKALQMVMVILILVILIAPCARSQSPEQGVNSGQPAIVERVIPIGDYRFHYKNQGAGAPTVVMDAGLCQPMDTWGDVVAQVSAFTPVFIYDRPGLGNSSRILPQGDKQPARPPEMRTSRHIVEELRDLLRKAGVPAPYVLVGHSFGGLNVRLYASQYPDEVAGIVLIDGSNEEEFSRYASLMPAAKRSKYVQLNRGSNCEFVNLEASAVQLREAAPLPRVPLTVISAPPGLGDIDRGQAHLELQADLARRGGSAVHIFADGSDHFIQRDRPDVVVKAIRDVVDRARTSFIPLPTEDDLKQTGIMHVSIPGEAAFSGTALTLSGLAGWRWRKRKRREKTETNRAMRRQAWRKAKKGSGE
jgi:pimeloyl-ACP methyl ester carboxylesterase